MSTLYGHKKSVRALCTDPDGKKILSASSDYIIAWELPLGDIIQEIQAQDIAINSITSNQHGVVVAGGTYYCYIDSIFLFCLCFGRCIQ